MYRSILIALLLLLSACAVAEDDETRTVTVTGTGTATAAPDRATVNMSIVARHKTVDAAQKEAAQVTAKILSMTEKLDIDKEHVDTTGSSVRPDYRWNRDTEEQELRGYIAERQMRVEVRDLEKLGKIVEQAVAAGVNQVTPPQLDSSKRRDAYRAALANAAEDARRNAGVLADSLGAELGDVVQINSGSMVRPPMPMMRNMAVADEMAESAAQTYNPGSLTFNATVTVVFELTD